MTRTTIRSEDITAGQVKSADLASDAVDTTSLETDIALLGFKVAANGSMAAYNLKDQTIDAFEDTSGVDASTSTDEVHNTAGKYYSSVGTETLLTQGGTAPTGLADSMLSVSGFSTWNVATLNDSAEGGSGLLADGAGAGSYVMLDLGSGNEKNITKAGMYYQNTNIYCQFYSIEWSTDDSSYTSIAFSTNIGGTPSASGRQQSNSFSGPGAKRYWRLIKANSATNGSWMSSIQFYHTPINDEMTLVSNATTAESTPSTGDIVLTYTNGSGTATINTDLKAWISRDNGTTYTQATLTSEGTTGGHTILTAHNVDISSQPSGTSMRYKITTHNQSTSKETRIQAVSLGWA